MKILIVLPATWESYPSGHLPASLEARHGVMQEQVRTDTVVDVDALAAGSPSLHKPGGNSGQLALVTRPIIERVVQAEGEGYDAVVQYGMLDPGTEAARHFVRIPVVGSGRAGLLAAAALGDRIGAIVYQPSLLTVASRMVRAYGMEGWITSIQAVDIPPTEMSARADDLFERMVRLSRRAIDADGAQVILPLGLSMTPLVVPAARLAEALGVPVVDGLTAAIRLAETLVLMGTSQSPLAYPAGSLG